MKWNRIGIVGWMVSFFVLLTSNKIDVKEQDEQTQYYTSQIHQKEESDPLFMLGQVLFYQIDLSKQRNTSCASCHLQVTGFAHVDHNLSHGTHGVFGLRNAPGLWNLKGRKLFMHDGRVTNLRELSIHPITDSLEMDMTFEEMIPRLEYLYYMKERFLKAFGDEAITKDRILDALHAFVIELESTNARYDKVMKKQKGYYFTTDEEQGYRLFKQQCASCHSGVNFSNQKFERNGIDFDPALYDLGRMRVTGAQKDSFKFLVPSLRNITETFPYMHDGRFQTLDEVLLHYQGLAKTSTKGALAKIRFSDKEKQQLKLFLETLTDTSFLTNPNFGFPSNEF